MNLRRVDQGRNILKPLRRVRWGLDSLLPGPEGSHLLLAGYNQLINGINTHLLSLTQMESYIKEMNVIEVSRGNAAEWPQRLPEVGESTLKCFMARLGVQLRHRS